MRVPQLLPEFRRHLGWLVVWPLVLLSLILPCSGQIDTGINQSAWKWTYGVTDAQAGSTAWLAADDDGDGMSNQAERDAGTHPFKLTSVLRISTLTSNATTVSMTFPTVANKLYLAQSTTRLKPASWQAVSGIQVAGDGGNKTLTVAKSAGAFFRVLVQDVDTDKDGVGDWAEIALGLSPTNATSNGQVDVNGLPISDKVRANALFAAQGKISISASDSTAIQPATIGEPASDFGKLKISRNGFAQFLPARTVNLSISGTAAAGLDYAALPVTVSFLASEVSKEIVVTPRYNSARKTGASVVATLLPSPNYSIAGPGWAAVIVNPTSAPTGTGLLARYYNTANSTYAHGANFGQDGTYVFTRDTTTTTIGSVAVSYTSGDLSALKVGDLVRLTFTSGTSAGAVNNAAFNNLDYTVTAVTASSFTVAVTSATAFTVATASGNCNFSIQSFPHPAVIERVDAVVNNDWMGGTANGNAIAPNNSPDNYSSVWEGYLSPSSPGAYTFQLDADDQARVLLDTGSGLVQILEHGWNGSPATVGTFKQTPTPITLAVPASAAQRYKIRVEHVETTGTARCRLQWKLGSGGYSNIPQGNVFTHTAAMTSNYNYTRNLDGVTGSVVVTLSGGHSFAVNSYAKLFFSSGPLFTPPASYQGALYKVTAFTPTTFTVEIAGAGLPTSGQGGGFVGNQSNSTATGWFNQIYANTAFTAPPGRVGVDPNGPTTSNNGLYGTGTPDAALINPDTFSVRWTGQVQPQFSEEYTFVVHADDSCVLKINGQTQSLKAAASTMLGGSSYLYDSATGDTVINYASAGVPADSFAVGQIVRLDPTSGNLNHAVGGTYSYDGATGDAVITYSSLTNVTPNGFVVGETVELDPTSGNLSPLGTVGYVIKAATDTTFTVNFGTGTYVTGPGNITIADTRDGRITAATPTTFTVKFGLGKYANGSTGNINIEIINRPLKDWASMGNERFVRIPLVGGLRYDIQLDYWENSGFARCFLYWYSSSQPKQIIPAERLYPANAVPAGASVTSPIAASAVVKDAFTYALTGTNGGTVNISGNPAWLTLNNGVLSGTPPVGAGGDYQILLTTTNAKGTGTSVLNLHVDELTGAITREYWTNLSGNNVSSIPVNTPPSRTSTVSTLQAPSNFSQNYGTRLRGYITAPVTGNYYFWLAASTAAELWISNDSEPVNKLKRASVTAGSATPLDWAAAQKTPWLALEAGQKYYVEVLHKTGSGAGDNLAVGWLKPGQAGNVPSEVVPSPVLSPYYDTPALANPGTLFVSTMLSQNGAITSGVGGSTLRLSADETTATMTYNYRGLTGPITSQHIHTDAYLGNPSTIVFDIDTPANPGDGLQPDGSYKWTITPVGTLSAADIREIIKQGKAYINLHTAAYPSGEIRGNYTLAVGSRTFTAPPAPPTLTDDHATDVGAIRFLTQATFGPNIADIAALKAMASYNAWIDNQFDQVAKPPSYQLPEVLRTENASSQGGAFDETLTFNAWWRNVISGPDQLRQRVAFALSEIHVVSAQGPLDNNALALSYFYDKLVGNAFGNFRDILRDTTLTPAMGRYLDMLRNDKPDLSLGRIPNENYAREIKQLFSVGLYRLWPDGTLILNSKDSPVDTYHQREIVGFAHVFTGWDYGYDGAFRTSLGAAGNWTRQMREVPARHFTGPKRILNNEVLPGLTSANGQPLDPYATHNSTHFSDPNYQALPAIELNAAHDQLFNHPNVGPFICRQLIQRLVTSTPSRDYLYRVVQKFNDDGSGLPTSRGNMKAVIKAILVDYEARSITAATKPAFGKQREPVLAVAAAARAFRTDPWSGTYSQTGTRTIAVNTATPHKLATGNNVFLDFTTGSPTPWVGTYSATVIDEDTFTVDAQGWAAGTYDIPPNSPTATITMNNHWLQAGHKFFVDFTSGAADGDAGLDGAVYTAATASAESGNNGTVTFAISGVEVSPSGRSGNVMIPRFSPGSYTITDLNPVVSGQKRITMDTNYDHHLAVGDQVQLNFYGGNPLPADLVIAVESVPDRNTYTALVTVTGGSNLGTNQGFDSVYQFPLRSQPLTRSGNVSSRPSTFAVGNTDTVLDQSPLNSPTVFNFFLPDFKFPGALASQGLTTPEFQNTAETTVIRQAQFFYDGIFNPGNTNGISSFRSGGSALVMDYSPWMTSAATNVGLGLPTDTTKPWTNNENVAALIDQLSTLLAAGQLSAQAKAIIRNFVAQPIASIGTDLTACTVTTTTPHGLSTGASVVISGVNGGTFGGTANGLNSTTNARTVTVTGTNTFTIPLSCSAAPAAAGLTTAHVSVIAYNNATTTTASAPSATNMRDRLRAIIHLILTSPDYTIQR